MGLALECCPGGLEAVLAVMHVVSARGEEQTAKPTEESVDPHVPAWEEAM